MLTMPLVVIAISIASISNTASVHQRSLDSETVAVESTVHKDCKIISISDGPRDYDTVKFTDSAGIEHTAKVLADSSYRDAIAAALANGTTVNLEVNKRGIITSMPDGR